MVACVDKGPRKQAKKIDPAYIQAHILSAVPTLSNVMAEGGADFGGKIIYLGNNLSTRVLKPGGKITIDHYWKVVEAPGADWRVFAHVNGAKPQDWMNVDYTDMRVGYPPGKWKAGDIIHDEQKFALKKDWSSPYADVLVGLYKKGGQSIKDRMPILSGPADDQLRLKVVRIEVDVAGGVVKSDKYKIGRASSAITIDGKADEEAWSKAPESPDFAGAEGGAGAASGSTARLLWDDEFVYAFIQVVDSDVASQYKNNDDPMWKEDCVELFIDADKNRSGYVELQVNPHNAQFDSWFAKTRREGGDESFAAHMKSAVVVNGTVDKAGDTDTGWQAEIAIPLAAVKGGDAAMKVELPPKAGDSWRLNIVHIDKPASGSMKVASWNPITMSDFHALGRMLTVTFADAEGKLPVAPTPATSVAPPAAGAEVAAPGETKIDKAVRKRRQLPKKPQVKPDTPTAP